MDLTLAKPTPYQAPNNYRNAVVLGCHDGDTPHLRIDAGFPGTPLSFGADPSGDNRVRMAYINSPEMSTPQGPPAKAHLEKLCADYGCNVGCVVEVLGRDNYGRPVVVLWGTFNGQPVNLNDQMIQDKFAVRQYG